MLRKWNADTGIALMVLFLVHCIAGGLQILGLVPGGSAALTGVSHLMMLLMAVHAVIGVVLTAKTLRLLKRAGAAYLRGNELFWARRISGFALLLLIAAHMLIFHSKGSPVRLSAFYGPQLAASILLVLALAVHLMTNIRPLLIALGISGGSPYRKDILLILAALLLAAGVAFVFYYFRWNVIWRP